MFIHSQMILHIQAITVSKLTRFILPQLNKLLRYCFQNDFAYLFSILFYIFFAPFRHWISHYHQVELRFFFNSETQSIVALLWMTLFLTLVTCSPPYLKPNNSKPARDHLFQSITNLIPRSLYYIFCLRSQEQSRSPDDNNESRKHHCQMNYSRHHLFLSPDIYIQSSFF